MICFCWLNSNRTTPLTKKKHAELYVFLCGALSQFGKEERAKVKEGYLVCAFVS